MRNIFSKITSSYKEIPNKKPYIEFLAALLSIPVLLTVILLNVSSLRSDKNEKTTTVPTTEKIYVTVPGSSVKTLPNNNTTSEPCTPGIGDININSPEENEIVTENPVNVVVNYKQGQYCEAVWSYRINGGKWSDYDDKSIALYNLSKGNIKFELRVKSIVNNDTDSLTRNFVYQGDSTTPISSSSAN